MILPDVLAPRLRLVFCGTAVGDESARRQAYFAGPGNQFWEILAKTGLTPVRLFPEQYALLTQYRIGLTDLVKERFGSDGRLSSRDFDIGGFEAKINRYEPKTVAFNGKKAAGAYLGRRVEYGEQPERIERTAIFVLPSTSGAARVFWNPAYWHDLARYVGAAESVPVGDSEREETKTIRRGAMAVISRKRVLRPSTRMPESPYRVKTEDVGPNDTFVLTICHESDPKRPIGVFEFRGSEIAGRNSIYFKVAGSGDSWRLSFAGANPFTTRLYTSPSS